MSVLLVRQKVKERRDAAAGAAVRDRFATLTRAARRPGPPPPPPRPCSRLAGQRIGRYSTCCTPVVQQDEVVEHDLDAGMTLARRGILPAQRMEPARDIDVAALVTYWAQTSANVPQAMHGVHSVVSCTWLAASFQRKLVAMLNVVRAVPVAVYFTSGSCPRWPMSWTRFRSCMVIPPLAPPVSNRKAAMLSARQT